MTYTTANVNELRTGTGWTIDVTACNLSEDLTLKDFNVLHAGTLVGNTDYAKTTFTTLTYSGTALPTDTAVEIRRKTPDDPLTSESVEYTQQFQSSDYRNEFNRAYRIFNEIELNGVGPGQDINVDIDNSVYSSAWQPDTVQGASRQALYNKIESLSNDFAPINNPTFTGDVVIPTVAYPDSSTKAASTAFVSANFLPIATNTIVTAQHTWSNQQTFNGSIVVGSAGALDVNSSGAATFANGLTVEGGMLMLNSGSSGVFASADAVTVPNVTDPTVNTTKAANTAFIQALLDADRTIDGDKTFTGAITFSGITSVTGSLLVPNQSTGDSDTDAANTAFVQQEIDANRTIDGNKVYAGTAEFDAATTFDGTVQLNNTVTAGATTIDLDGASSVTVPTQEPEDNDTSAASTAFVQSLLVDMGVEGLRAEFNQLDLEHDVDIAPGSCLALGGSGSHVRHSLSSTLVKQIDAAWAVGNNAGGLDTGTVAANSTYYIWAIHRVDTNVSDVLFSLSKTSPTLPTGYAYGKVIGRIITDGSSNILTLADIRGDRLFEKNFYDFSSAGDTNGFLYDMGTYFGVNSSFFQPDLIFAAGTPWKERYPALIKSWCPEYNNPHEPSYSLERISANRFTSNNAAGDDQIVYQLMDGSSIKLTNYSMAQPSAVGEYSRDWELLGSVNGKRWHVINSHVADTTIAAGNTWYNFSLTETDEYWKFLRVAHTGNNSAGNRQLAINGIEFYGTRLVEGSINL